MTSKTNHPALFTLLGLRTERPTTSVDDRGHTIHTVDVCHLQAVISSGSPDGIQIENTTTGEWWFLPTVEALEVLQAAL